MKVRFGDFTTRTRSRTLPAVLATGQALGAVAADLLDELPPGPGVRLLGVHASLLVPRDEAAAGPEQLSLFAPPGDPETGADGTQRREGVEAAADAIRDRFGAAAIASLAATARRAGAG